MSSASTSLTATPCNINITCFVGHCLHGIVLAFFLTRRRRSVRLGRICLVVPFGGNDAGWLPFIWLIWRKMPVSICYLQKTTMEARAFRQEARDSMRVRADGRVGMATPSKTIRIKSKDNLTKALLHDQTGPGRWSNLIRCSDLLHLCQTEVEDFA